MNIIYGEEWKVIIEEWKQSGQSKSDYCKLQSISYFKLRYWINKFNKENKSDSKFIKIKLPFVKQSSEIYCEVQLPSGVKVIFKQQPDIEYIKQICS